MARKNLAPEENTRQEKILSMYAKGMTAGAYLFLIIISICDTITPENAVKWEHSNFLFEPPVRVFLTVFTKQISI